MGAKCSTCGRRTEAIPEQGQRTIQPAGSLMQTETETLLSTHADHSEKPQKSDGESKEGESKEGESKEGGIGGLIFMCCCCCICLLLPLCFSIPAIVLSRGFTECPAPGTETVTGTEENFLPKYHTMEVPRWQFFAFLGGQEMNVFDPRVSNTTRVGYWRTTKNWFLRTQFAYVPEGSETPQVVVSRPIFAWTREYALELCPTQQQWRVSQNIFVFGGWTQLLGFEHFEEFSIYEEPGDKLVAKASHSKDTWSWHGWFPDGWKSVITSEVEPGKKIGAMIQTKNIFWTDSASSRWVVVDEQPDMLSPTVMSFLAAAYELDKKDKDDGSDSSRRRRHRRLSNSTGASEEHTHGFKFQAAFEEHTSGKAP